MYTLFIVIPFVTGYNKTWRHNERHIEVPHIRDRGGGIIGNPGPFLCSPVIYGPPLFPLTKFCRIYCAQIRLRKKQIKHKMSENALCVAARSNLVRKCILRLDQTEFFIF